MFTNDIYYYMSKNNNKLPAPAMAEIPTPDSKRDVEWLAKLSHQNRGEQIAAMEESITDNNPWRVYALLQLPISDGTFTKTGIIFQSYKQSFFTRAVNHNSLKALRIIVSCNKGLAHDLLDKEPSGSLENAIRNNRDPDPELISFLLDIGADPFKDNMAGISLAVEKHQLDVVNAFLDKVPFTIEPLKELLTKAKNDDVYVAIEKKLIAAKLQRAEKIKIAQKEATPEQTERWFPVGDFQIMHIEKANDSLETTISHIFNFKAEHMTRRITDNQNAVTSETFKFSAIREATNLIQTAREELLKHNPKLPRVQSMRTISPREPEAAPTPPREPEVKPVANKAKPKPRPKPRRKPK